MEITPRSIAADLLSIGAVFLRPDEPFTWASGIKSPIYCDNRLTLSSPKVRYRVEMGLAGLVQKQFPEVQLIAGTATAGIAHAALVADILDLPMCYVRGKAKDHGRENRIEGRAEPGQKVVVIEDLISTGGSVLEVVETLKEAGCEVLGIVAIFSYELAAGKEKMDAAGVRLVTLSNFGALVEEALSQNSIKKEDLAKLKAFQQNPRDDGWMSR
ncbi:orotate phosphoribosyltransferase [Ruminococcaceae bacterium OttesenSCG-928-I18]|nr:orotate phosphoribosyltransferase [Ruminococcaceae bacterium OttesenSCG-928-I18]